jgi:hypothetical protein
MSQRARHAKNKMRQDRKELLDKLEFVWISDALDSQRNEQHEKLVEFKTKNGHCAVPHKCEKDESLCFWVASQRQHHAKNKMRQDRKELLHKLDFVWKADSHGRLGCFLKADSIATRSSATDARCVTIGSFQALGRSCFSLLIIFLLNTCRVRMQKRSAAVSVSQTKHQKKWNHHKAALETD